MQEMSVNRGNMQPKPVSKYVTNCKSTRLYLKGIKEQTMTHHYDVIIIGTGAGGGTLAYKLAGSGKRILLLERGDCLPVKKKIGMRPLSLRKIKASIPLHHIYPLRWALKSNK